MFFNHGIKISLAFVLCLLLGILYSCSSNKISDTFNPLEITTISNLSTLLEESRASSFLKQGAHCQGLKIAVLDNGTSSLTQRLGRTLPDNVKTLNVDYNDNSDTDIHGVVILESISAICSGSETYDSSIPGPELYLYNTQGIKRLFEAVDNVVKNKIDIVVYAQVWELGGNLDGTGFINKKINEAIDNGTVWFNAIGNYKDKTFYSQVRPSYEKYRVNHTRLSHHGPAVALPYSDNSLRIEIKENATPVLIKLGWSAFPNNFDDYTTTDLDMYLEDSTGKLIGQSDFTQGKDHTSTHKKHRGNLPIETMNLILDKGIYYLHITTKTPHVFEENKYNMWIALVTGDNATLLDTNQNNSSLIFVPADNPKTISVISTDCHCESESSVVRDYNNNEIKWDTAMVSKIEYSNNTIYLGSSTATGVSAAVFGLYVSWIKNQNQKLNQSSSTSRSLKSLVNSFIKLNNKYVK